MVSAHRARDLCMTFPLFACPYSHILQACRAAPERHIEGIMSPSGPRALFNIAHAQAPLEQCIRSIKDTS
jgi:hypothetical protein